MKCIIGLLGLVGCILVQPCAYSQNIIQPDGQLEIWACISPPPIWPIYVSFYSSVNAYSGYHNHTSGRPPGTVNPTGGYTDPGSGCAHTVFSVPQQIAGDYYVEAAGGGTYAGTMVGVYYQPFLTNLPPYYPYQLVGGTTSHPNNHYGSTNAVYSIQQICLEFYNQAGLRAGVNDMSLPLGGVFDIGPPYGSYWAPPHDAHRTGLNADFPFQYLGTDQQRAAFRVIATNRGGSPAEHGSPPDHFHLSFSN